MDAPEHDDFSMQRVKEFIHGWIQTLQRGPTPERFPFNEVPMQTMFAWDEFYPEVTYRHCVVVELKFTRQASTHDIEDPTTRFSWTVTVYAHSHPPLILSYFEVDCRIVFDRHRLVSLDAKLITQALLTSLHESRALELSSNIIAEEPCLENYYLLALDRCIETFQIRDSYDPGFVKELQNGRRWIPKRQCDACGHLIPPTGPALCLADLHSGRIQS